MRSQSASPDDHLDARRDAHTATDDGGAGGENAGDAAQDLFITETMAELSARQGRTADAAAIYRRLIAGTDDPERQARWQARVAALEGGDLGDKLGGNAAGNLRGPPAAPAPGAAARTPLSSVPPVRPPGLVPSPASVLRLPLVVQTQVRSGQIVYAEGRDLIVLSPVNPGAQLLADGNIHVYAPLRGRAVAGVRGAVDAQIFCQRLEAELVGVDAAYVAAEDLPRQLMGKGARVWWAAGACRFAPL